MIERARCWRTALLLFLLLAAAALRAQDSDQPGQVSLTIYPVHVALNPAQTQRFSARVDGAPAGTVIRWTITGSAAGGSISQDGVFTARTLGIYHVVAFVPIGQSTVAKTAAATVTVLRPLDF
jgi:hypothetical protein